MSPLERPGWYSFARSPHLAAGVIDPPWEAVSNLFFAVSEQSTAYLARFNALPSLGRHTHTRSLSLSFTRSEERIISYHHIGGIAQNRVES